MSNSADQVREPEGTAKRSNWPLMRKVEAVVFLAMFLAVPLFAFRVLQYTHAALTVRNVCRELVQDLARARALAIQLQEPIEVNGSKQSERFLQRNSYSISTPQRVIEDLVLPENVQVSGNVLFTERGQPKAPSSFIVSSFNRNMTAEIDQNGEVSVP
ncbi:MAG: hypothetical protein SGJ27_19985 [Candidatus Melainabacteria bacterium]|nr:hypothetical protein [Candidatus Melainabacteria bacterium]